MDRIILDTLWEVFEKLKRISLENNAEIVSLDDYKRLLLGWGCHKTNDFFYVRLTSVQMRKALKLPFEHPEMYDLLEELIKTPEGRVKIANILSSPSPTVQGSFERMLALKAFW